MNVFDQNGFKVILDYGHNPAAVDAMCTLVDRLAQSDSLAPTESVSACWLPPATAETKDIVKIASIAANRFDRYTGKRDDHRRGRGDEEVPVMLKKALIESGVDEADIDLIVSEEVALRAPSKAANRRPLLIFADNISRTWKQITKFGDNARVEPEPEEPQPPSLASLGDGYPEFEPPEGQKLIRDSRGVLLAADEEAD